MDLAGCLDSAREVALAAGKVIREAHEDRSKGLGVEIKGGTHEHVDLVTAVDKACEALIIDTLKARYPGHAFIGEESSAAMPEGPLQLGDQPTWIIDPVDGTTNFVHGYPFVTVSIGLAVGGEPVLGVIYNPIMDELCSAMRGCGATLNGQPVRVGSATGVTSAVVCNNFGASREPAVNALCTARLNALLQNSVRGVRNSGSAAQNMMHVACGRLDAYFEEGFGGPWDVAAGKIIIEEAGGTCKMVLGDAFTLLAGKGQILCGNEAVVDDIARVLRDVVPPST